LFDLQLFTILSQDTPTWEDVALQNLQIQDKPVSTNEVELQGKDITEQAIYMQ
jgi:hypothetical protein